MTEEIRKKIKQKRPVCDAKSGKRKSFPLSLQASTGPPSCTSPREPTIMSRKDGPKLAKENEI